MSKANRKRVYDKLVKKGRLDRDDGALVKEFGKPSPNKAPDNTKDFLGTKPEEKKVKK